MRCAHKIYGRIGNRTTLQSSEADVGFKICRMVDFSTFADFLQAYFS